MLSQECSEECCYCGPGTDTEPQCKGNPNGKECPPRVGSNCIDEPVEPTTSKGYIKSSSTTLVLKPSPIFQSVLPSSSVIIHSYVQHSNKQHTVSSQPETPPDPESTTRKPSEVNQKQIRNTLYAVLVLVVLTILSYMLYKSKKIQTIWAAYRSRAGFESLNSRNEDKLKELLKNENLMNQTVKDVLGTPVAKTRIFISGDTAMECFFKIFTKERKIELLGNNYRSGMLLNEMDFKLTVTNQPKSYKELIDIMSRLTPTLKVGEFINLIKYISGVETILMHLEDQ